MKNQQSLQPPLVLQVDSAPKSKLCIQPDINPNSHRGRISVQPPFLPGLPDDLAIACLIRVPRIEHRKLHLVCKRWHRLLSEELFYSLRKSRGIAEDWLYIVKTYRGGRISVHAFDPIYQLWQPLPPVPEDFPEAIMWFSCAVLSDCHLYLLGGVDMEGSVSISRVVFYSARTNKWHRAPDMLQKRNLFRSCVINNCIYVAGGELERNQMTRSAEVYDPDQNSWSLISEMSTSMVPWFGVVHNGTWFFKGNAIGSGNSVCEAYSPETDTWTQVTNGMVNGWGNHCNCISLNGQLYALDCRDGCKLSVYDSETDSWKKFIDSKLHLDSSPAHDAAPPVSLNGKLCIIRQNMSISLVDVSSPIEQVENNPHLWKNIAGEDHPRSLVRKLWSTITGRGHSNSDGYIECCQFEVY
ncbi:F-box/kelch-repeat protein, partial [Mucuna pruriens]